MGVRKVRLDDNAEATLAALQEQTGMSISDILKRGLNAFAREAREKSAGRPYEVYRRLELVSEDHAADSAAEAKSRVADIIKNKYGR